MALGNRAKGKKWQDAIRRSLARYESATVPRGTALLHIANKLVANAVEGDKDAIKEIGDRLDGKAAQRVEVDGELRHVDISAEPLTADEWEQAYTSH